MDQEYIMERRMNMNMKYTTDQVEEHINFVIGTLIPDLKTSGNTATAESFETGMNMLQEQLEDRCDLIHQLNHHKEPIIIEYYVRESYGRPLEYILNGAQRQIIQNLTRQKTIDEVIRELLRDLTGSHIIWKQVLPPGQS
jgi:hypothetical protein